MCCLKDPSKNYKKLLLKLTRASKPNHFNKFFIENKLNLFRTWEGIREIINISKKESKVINRIQNSNNMTDNSPKEIAEQFTKHFTCIGKNIEKRLIKPNCDFSNFLKNPNKDSFFITPTNKDEVAPIIKTLKNNKSIGLKVFQNTLSKVFQNTLSESIALLANLSFSTGTFFTNLKTANLIPLFKTDGNTLCSNYRPIACGVFLDLRKPFDTVNHDILLRKLDYYDISGITNNWFRSYLQDRMRFTSVNGYQSNMRQLKYGVPQGSTLGPLLFILFINDLHLVVQYSSVHQFAGDTNLLVSEKSLKQLNKKVNRDLKLTVEWARANKLSLNANKTDIIIFKPRNKTITKHLNFRISGQKIKPTNQVKYLGIILQEDLHWTKYLSNLGKKLNLSIGLLSKIRHYT